MWGLLSLPVIGFSIWIVYQVLKPVDQVLKPVDEVQAPTCPRCGTRLSLVTDGARRVWRCSWHGPVAEA